MNPILLCQHCGNKTSHTIIEKGLEKEYAEFEDGVTYDIDIDLWFTKCDNCHKHSLFFCLNDNSDESSCLWPNERRIDQAVPKKINIAYKEAIKVKKISKIAFIILIRRSLEILCKHEKVNGKDLKSKIKKLGEFEIIPQKLTDMADLIRLLGNDGVHKTDITISDNEINLLDDFFLAIIEYIYIAPEKIKKIKNRIEKK